MSNLFAAQSPKSGGGLSEAQVNALIEAYAARVDIYIDDPDANALLVGNGSNPLQLIAPGTSGQFLRSNGTVWAASAIQSSDLTTPLTTPPAIGGTTPAAGAFTTVRANPGTAAAPGHSFNADTNTGMSAETADTLVLSAGGAAKLTLTTTQLSSSMTRTDSSGTPVAFSLDAVFQPSAAGSFNASAMTVLASHDSVANNNNNQLYAIWGKVQVWNTRATYARRMAGVFASADAEDTTHNDSTGYIAGLAAQTAELHTGSLTNSYGVTIDDATASLGTKTNNVGLNIGNIANGTNNWAIRTGTGRVQFGDSVDIPAAGAYLLGDSVTNGSWRLTRSGNDLVIQRRESGSWVTKSTVAA